MSSTTSPAFITSLEKSPIKIEKWNLQDVKVTFDDLVVKFMNEELKYREDSFLLILKVAIYFLLNVIGVATGLYTYLTKPFAAARLLTGIGAAVYLLGMGLFTLLLQYHIVGTIYRGFNAKNRALWIQSKMLFPEATYLLRLSRPEAPKKPFLQFEIAAGSWLTEEGEIVGEAVYADLKREMKLE